MRAGKFYIGSNYPFLNIYYFYLFLLLDGIFILLNYRSHLVSFVTASLETRTKIFKQ